MARDKNPRVLSASTLAGDPVYNPAGEKLGTIEELMVDLATGRVVYAVLSFGGILGIGDKLFAIPWSGLQVDIAGKRVVFDVPRETLERAPGFDKNNWPNFADEQWGAEIHGFYGLTPYWEMSEIHIQRDQGEADTSRGDLDCPADADQPEDHPKNRSDR